MIRARSIPTPPRMRQAALACVMLGTFVGLYSGAETISLSNLQEQRERAAEEVARMDELSELAPPEMMIAVNEARFAVLEGMKNARSAVLVGLVIACFLTWICATRLIRPDGLPREGIRRTLVASLLAAAVLRTIDGAQWTVVSQRMAAAGVKYIGQAGNIDPEVVPIVKALLAPLCMGWSIAQTVLIAGSMLLLGQYFRSEKVKQVVALQDDSVSGEQ
ncbi:MAG: hypothetical protein IRZ16_13585 [Myxococcaceae bacterium]|nr:hypothetical protein [Myxococcaceae bacterium]